MAGFGPISLGKTVEHMHYTVTNNFEINSIERTLRYFKSKCNNFFMHVYCGSCSPYKIDAFYVNEAWAVFVFRRYISILISKALGNTINSFYFIILVC